MKWIIGIPLFLVATFFTAEGILRLQEQLLPPEKKFQKVITEEQMKNVFQVLLNPDRLDFFQPPYRIFANTGQENEERLKMIFEATLGPLGTSLDVHDRLMPESRERFRTTLNTKGFRGKDTSIEKRAGIKRIAVLGSYQAFGIGVSDHETYPEKLESFLNAGNAQSFEVLNAGRMSATAIVGLAHLKNNVLQYEPDLVILDFGFVDSILHEELVSITSRNGDQESIKTMFLRQLMKLKLGPLIWNRIYPLTPDNLKNFASVMDKMIAILADKKIPVILVNQLSLVPRLESYFVEAEKKGIPVLNVRSALEKVNLPDESWKEIGWLRDVPERYRREFPLAPFRKNLFQLNTHGYEAVAHYLAGLIKDRGLLP